MKSPLGRVLRVALFIFLGTFCGLAAEPDSLENTFLTPPTAAKPAVWWFWGESVTMEHGITQDLEALKRVGFGGVVIYEQVFADAPDALKSLSPEFMARVRFAAAECKRLGLTLELNACSGYVAGGPWITPALGMQRLVSSELQVDGGQKFSGLLPQPPTKLGFYQDVAVLAFPSRAGDEPHREPPLLGSTPALHGLSAMFDPSARYRADILPGSADRPVLIQMDYGHSFTARSLSYSLHPISKALVLVTQQPGYWSDTFTIPGMHPIPPIGQLELSNDGKQWQRVCDLPGRGYLQDSWNLQTVAFPAVTARFFRLDLHGWDGAGKGESLQLGNIRLNSEALIDQWEEKSGNVVDFSDPDRTPPYKGGEVIDPDTVVDLSVHMDAGGRLNWDVPPGRWTVLRFGHTPTGAGIKHGRPEGMGLECDKLSAEAAKVQYRNYFGRILNEIRKVPGARLSGMNLDSAESGSQNWTADFPAQFRQRRGYDLLRYLPTMAGRVVGSPEQSDRFLFDIRRTIADLLSDEHYGTMDKLCHADGMTLMAQAPGIATCMPCDNIQAKGRTDIPMGEFWYGQRNGTMDCKEAASAAHVYGLPVAAAESFTGSPFRASPETEKPLADAALSLGINRFVALADVHQPWDDRKPGVVEPKEILCFQRNNTWWEYSGGFWETLARSSAMMRQGQPVMDLLYHLGNDTPLKIAVWRMHPPPPAGYDYDVCGDEILLRARVKDGRLLLPGGMSYRMVVLAGGDRMTLAAARQLEALVKAGATVLGSSKPLGSPSLGDGPAGDAEVRRLADELWGPGKPAGSGERKTGLGSMVWGRSPADELGLLATPKDFEAQGADMDILYAHRRSGSEDIYFLANHRETPASFTGSFRSERGMPQAWNPETGAITALAGAVRKGPLTAVPIQLEAYQSLFVVFRDGPVPAKTTPGLVETLPVWQTFADAWEVRFDPRWGGPAHADFPRLISWADSADPGIRDYSGTATYIQEFNLPKTLPGRVVLDLGKVDVIASVIVNGQSFGDVWKAPFAVDVTAALHPGKNRLEVKVANLWANRLIADAGLPEAKRLTWISYPPVPGRCAANAFGPPRSGSPARRDACARRCRLPQEPVRDAPLRLHAGFGALHQLVELGVGRHLQGLHAVVFDDDLPALDGVLELAPVRARLIAAHLHFADGQARLGAGLERRERLRVRIFFEAHVVSPALDDDGATDGAFGHVLHGGVGRFDLQGQRLLHLVPVAERVAILRAIQDGLLGGHQQAVGLVGEAGGDQEEGHESEQGDERFHGASLPERRPESSAIRARRARSDGGAEDEFSQQMAVAMRLLFRALAQQRHGLPARQFFNEPKGEFLPAILDRRVRRVERRRGEHLFEVARHVFFPRDPARLESL